MACPLTTLTIDALDGYYTVTAENEFGESVFSNEILLATYYFNLVKYDYDTQGRVTYKGQHTDVEATDVDNNWIITRYYYDTGGRFIALKIRTTSWVDREQGW